MSKEIDHRHQSTMLGISMGKIQSLPVDDRFAGIVNREAVGNPYTLATVFTD